MIVLLLILFFFQSNMLRADAGNIPIKGEAVPVTAAPLTKDKESTGVKPEKKESLEDIFLEILDKIGEPFFEKIIKRVPLVETPLVPTPLPTPVGQTTSSPTVSTASTPAFEIPRVVKEIEPSRVLPVKPLISAVIQKPNFVVDGIFWSDKIHEAIINGQIVTVGD